VDSQQIYFPPKGVSSYRWFVFACSLVLLLLHGPTRSGAEASDHALCPPPSVISLLPPTQGTDHDDTSSVPGSVRILPYYAPVVSASAFYVAPWTFEPKVKYLPILVCGGLLANPVPLGLPDKGQVRGLILVPRFHSPALLLLLRLAETALELSEGRACIHFDVDVSEVEAITPQASGL
jgi:hypothetical protein